MINTVMLRTKQQRVGMTISKLSERTREWALACNGLSHEIRLRDKCRVFLHRLIRHIVCNQSLALRQEMKELSDYGQELRTILAIMQLNSLSEKVGAIIFVQGLRTGVARTEVYLSTFEDTVDVTLNAEFNFKAALSSKT